MPSKRFQAKAGDIGQEDHKEEDDEKGPLQARAINRPKNNEEVYKEGDQENGQEDREESNDDQETHLQKSGNEEENIQSIHTKEVRKENDDQENSTGVEEDDQKICQEVCSSPRKAGGEAQAVHSGTCVAKILERRHGRRQAPESQTIEQTQAGVGLPNPTDARLAQEHEAADRLRRSR
ncbi:MAG: hypothetical protein KC996_00710 [Phycisphaerales bacterium]|nr:hypothetical protein [Phycisphaerales bacterium]